ncbi:MAG TPA: SIS domain-containing protein [Jiangellaceae bacterium]|nr:SIS domain-containing protein [Jiangellaceae bacterium]
MTPLSSLTGLNGPAAHVRAEIASQPQTWRQAVATAAEHTRSFPEHGERVAVVGCGTSWFIAQAYAVRREQLGHGRTDAFAASEFPAGRDYDHVLGISRSGTTTEVLDLLRDLAGSTTTLAIVGDPASPAAQIADRCISLAFADEESVVQTRFATSTLSLLRASLGEDLSPVIDQAETVLDEQVPTPWLERTQFTFLGRGWSVGLAHEAALKMREAALAWTESYPAMDYRHGPISISDSRSVVFLLGEVPAGLPEQIEATGALAVPLGDEDPQLSLLRCQKLAVNLALAAGLDPDHPRNLSRSVVLDPGTPDSTA